LDDIIMADKAIDAQLGIQYEIDGHLYTTFAVAVLAGLPVPRALELAWGSQVPDANRRYTAVHAAWTVLWNEFSESIMETLHSLHGGDTHAVAKRRDQLEALIVEALARGEPDWKVGLMIHAFGDSYAHTHTKHGREEAYGTPIGHGHDGHTPDTIGRFPEKYLAYVVHLYRALGGAGDARARLDRLFDIVGQDGASDGRITRGIIAYAAELGMKDDESDRARERLLDEITVSDVRDTMREMERRFAA